MKTRLHKKEEVSYVGRLPSAATATGHLDSHNMELENFLVKAFE